MSRMSVVAVALVVMAVATRAQNATTNSSFSNVSFATDVKTPISVTETTAPVGGPNPSAPCSDSNPICSDSCYCNGRGTASSYTSGSWTWCYCSCRNGYWGGRCDSCAPGYVSSTVSGSLVCTKCIKQISGRMAHPVLSGATVSLDVPFDFTSTSCTAQFTSIVKYESSTTWSQTSLPVSQTVSVTPTCAASTYYYSGFYMVINGQWSWFWSPECVARKSWLTSTLEGSLQITELSITNLYVFAAGAESCYSWSENSYCYGLSLTSHLQIAVGVHAALKTRATLGYLVGGALTTKQYASTASASDISTLYSAAYAAMDNSQNDCVVYRNTLTALLAQVRASSTARSDLYVISDVVACGTTASRATIATISGLTNVIVVAAGGSYFVDSSNSSSATTATLEDALFIRYEANNDAVMEQFLATRFVSRPEKCSNEKPRIVPNAFPLFETSIAMVRDICGVLVKCCFGDVCAPAIRSPPACVVPWSVTTKPGEAVLTLHIWGNGNSRTVKVSRPVVFFDSPFDASMYVSQYYDWLYRGYSFSRSDLHCARPGYVDVARNFKPTAIAVPAGACSYDYEYSYTWGSYTYRYGYSYSSSASVAAAAWTNWPTCLAPQTAWSMFARKSFPRLVALPPTRLEALADAAEDSGCVVDTDYVVAKPSTVKLPAIAESVSLDVDVYEVLIVAVKAALKAALDSPAGRSVAHIRNALLAAGIAAAADGELRTCDSESKSLAGSDECRFAWSATAANVAKYLEAAGFEEVTTGWLETADADGNLIENARFGDVAVMPALEKSASKEKLEKGHVQMKFNGGWVSDVVQDASGVPYKAIGEFLTRKEKAKVKVRLFRLTAAVLKGINGVAVGQMSVWRYPQPTCDADSFCRDWSSSAVSIAAQIDYFNAYYRCPAVRGDWLPSELAWRWWIGGVMCWVMQPTVLVNGVGIRCCYEANGTYIPRYPSMIGYPYQVWGNRSTWFQTTADLYAENMCCASSFTGRNCQYFSEPHRPAPLTTNSPFTAPMRWTVGVRWAIAFGDPHCTSHDGKEFECNFRGEAVYASCDKFKLHVLSGPISDSVTRGGTIAKGVAIRSGDDTVYITALTTTTLNITLNDAVQNVTLNQPTNLGVFTAFAESSGSVEIQDAAGNTVSVSTAGSGKALNIGTRMGKACQGKAAGLLGNADGDTTNDMVPRGATATVTATTQREIYEKFVTTWVLSTASESILPAHAQDRTSGSWTPVFGDEVSLTDCPSACNGVKTCCFDVSQGLPAAASLTGSSKAQALNENTVSVGSTVTPPQIDLPTKLSVADGTRVTVTATASAGTTIASVTCSVCATEAACTTAGTATATATVSFVKTSNGRITCEATNDKKMKTTAASDVTSPSVVSGVLTLQPGIIAVIVVVIVVVVVVAIVIAVCLKRKASNAAAYAEKQSA